VTVNKVIIWEDIIYFRERLYNRDCKRIEQLKNSLKKKQKKWNTLPTEKVIKGIEKIKIFPLAKEESVFLLGSIHVSGLLSPAPSILSVVLRLFLLTYPLWSWDYPGLPDSSAWVQSYLRLWSRNSGWSKAAQVLWSSSKSQRLSCSGGGVAMSPCRISGEQC
jgi:hypothetical protein